jgi:hypothetical protein
MMKRTVTLILLSLVCGIEAGAQSALEVLQSMGEPLEDTYGQAGGSISPI